MPAGDAHELAIGCGSAWAADRLAPAVALADSGLVDYLAFDCLAERTLAHAQLRRREDPAAGHDPRLPEIVERFAGFLDGGGRIVGNFGAANVEAGARVAADGLRAAGLGGLAVGVIAGDDVREAVRRAHPELPELGGVRVSSLGERFVSANAYVGAEPIAELLDRGARFVIGGRLADPSLYVGPICHELGWALDDWDRLGTAVLAGHLLECGAHGAGGNYADPPGRVVPRPHDLGAPYARVAEDSVVVSKLPGSGGLVDAMVVKTQLAYEIHDPASYPTPDAVADFSAVSVRELGPDRVRARGATARPRPDQLKVLVGVDLGYRAVGEISFGGPGCVERLELGAEIVRRRLEPLAGDIEEIHYDAHGLSALFGAAAPPREPFEARLRVAARCASRAAAEAVADEVEFLYFGPAGAGGATKRVEPAIGVTSALIDRSEVALTTEVLTA